MKRIKTIETRDLKKSVKTGGLHVSQLVKHLAALLTSSAKSA